MEILEKRIKVGNLTVQLWETGQEHGRAVLLLHGGIGDACANWHQMLPGLSEHYHVFAPNLPGYGDSSLLPNMTIDALLIWLRDLLNTLEISSAVMVGSFLGALLARLFAAAQPAYIPALILVDGGGIPNFPRPLAKLMSTPGLGTIVLELFGLLTSARKTLDDMMYVKSAITEELIASWQHNQPAFKHLIRAMITNNYTQKQMPLMPTLLLWGANDPMMPLTAAEQIKQNLPGTTLVPIEECGLMPQLEATDVLMFQLGAFLDRLDRPRLPVNPGAGILRPLNGASHLN